MAIERFGILGGDERMTWLARSLSRKGYEVHTCGLPDSDCSCARQLACRCGPILLPYPVTRDGHTVSGPGKIPLDEELSQSLQGHPVWAGSCGLLHRFLPGSEKLQLFDYGEQEDFLQENAALTAEGAVALAVFHSKRSLIKSRCVVAGYGRIGQKLCRLLKSYTPWVFAGCRREESVQAARAAGFSAGTRFPAEACDFLFNTVPARIFDENTALLFSEGGLFIELASAPGGAGAGWG